MANPLQAQALDPLINEAFMQQQEEIERLRAELKRYKATMIYSPPNAGGAIVCRGCWHVGWPEGSRHGVTLLHHADNCWVAALLES